MSNITEIQRLLNEKADLQAQINISAFDGSIEVKTVNDQKYIYVRKREAGKYKSNYIDKYSEELYALAVNQSQQIRAVKKQLRKIEKDLAKLGYTESELSPRVKLNIDFATIANVRKMNDGVEVMFHKNVDLEARDSQTDKNIVRYFELLGKNEIDKKKYPDLFFCNCNLGYRRDKYSGNMTRKILANDAAEIKSLIDIIEPENIICLGLDTSVVVIRTLLDKKFSCNRVSELIGTGEPYTYGETYIYPVAHPGYWGTSTRGEDNVIADWRRIRK